MGTTLPNFSEMQRQAQVDQIGRFMHRKIVKMGYCDHLLASASDPILAAASAPFDQALPGFSYEAPPKPSRGMRRPK